MSHHVQKTPTAQILVINSGKETGPKDPNGALGLIAYGGKLTQVGKKEHMDETKTKKMVRGREQ